MRDFEQSLNELLSETFYTILKYEAHSLRTMVDPDVTVAEAHLLEVIGREPAGLSTGDIATALNIAPPTATVAIKKLVSKGFVQKSPCPEDGRRSIITLTPRGRRIDRAHTFFHRKMVHNISGKFNQTEKQVLLSAVDTLNTFFKENIKAE